MNIRELMGQGQNPGQPLSQGLHTDRKGYIVEKGFPAERGVFETDQRTVMDPVHGAITQEVVKLYKLDCGHVVTSNTELLGRCMKCNDHWVCFRCGVRCNRCLKLLCTSCIRLVNGVAYCKSCRVIVWLMKGSSSGLRKVHNGLSAKI